MEEIDLVEDYPARIAEMLLNDEIDIGLIPVAATIKMKEWHIVGDYCIGTEGEVASVCIFSQVPMEEIEEVLLDYQSRTSVALGKILLKKYWKKEVKLTDARGEDFRSRISGTTAGLVIGDRALEQRTSSQYIYDLGTAWKAHTGLPFVFAAWISNKPVSPEFILKFNHALGSGISMMDDVIKEIDFPIYDIKEYYKKNISYRLDKEKMKGMQLFLSLLNGSGTH